MNLYIFYTGEGCCESPDGCEVDNFQVLGVASGETPQEALEQLLENEDWVIGGSYTKGGIKARKLANNRVIHFN